MGCSIEISHDMWKAWSLANSSGWPWRWNKKKSKTREWCSYQTAHVGHGDGRRKESKTGEDGSYQIAELFLAMETDEERKAKLEKMVATAQLMLT